MEFYHRVIHNADTRIQNFEHEEGSGEGSGETMDQFSLSGSDNIAMDDDYQFLNELDWLTVQIYIFEQWCSKYFATTQTCMASLNTGFLHSKI